MMQHRGADEQLCCRGRLPVSCFDVQPAAFDLDLGSCSLPESADSESDSGRESVVHAPDSASEAESCLSELS